MEKKPSDPINSKNERDLVITFYFFIQNQSLYPVKMLYPKTTLAGYPCTHVFSSHHPQPMVVV